jgi:superfamily II DNA/RNA helicase
MTFSDLGLDEDTLRAVTDAGYTTPTPIQEKAIPVVLMGRDILGCAQTGTGKTASFTLPMIDILAAGRAKARMPRSLILEPTRELAAQVAHNFDVYGKYHPLSKALLIGGTSMNDQIRSMEKGVDVLIATPGRLLDLFDRGQLLMNDVKILVIDEADRMLDMGFIPDVERIISLLSKIRQTLFFSATMAPEIRRLADAFLSNPKEISVSPPASTAETITQTLVRVRGSARGKPGALQKEKRDALRRQINQKNVKNALIFCNRKRDVSVVFRSLQRHGHATAQLHGDMSQPARMETLENFKAGNAKFLVCSDVAARGLDIPNMSHVFNFDVPTHAEDYVHRIGRTGRAGKDGYAVTLACDEDTKYLAAIEKLIGKSISAVTPNAAEKGNEKPNNKTADEGQKEERPERPRPEKERKASETHPERPEKKKEKPQARPEKPAKKENSSVGMGDHPPAFMMQPRFVLPKSDEPKNPPAKKSTAKKKSS